MTLISFAQAAAGDVPQGGILQSPLPMILIMGVMMFILFRSQSKRQREMEAIQKALKVGDEVITAGGMHGIIASLRDKTVVVKFDSVKIEFDRSAIATVKKKSDVIEA
jgi:preprotein translocase subunit YajC